MLYGNQVKGKAMGKRGMLHAGSACALLCGLLAIPAAAVESGAVLTDYWIEAADGRDQRTETVRFTTSEPVHFELDKWTYADCVFVYSADLAWDGSSCASGECMKKLEECLPRHYVKQAYPFQDERGYGLKIELCNCAEINRHAVRLVNLHEAGQGVHSLLIPARQQLDPYQPPQDVLTGGIVVERIPLHYVSAAEAEAYLKVIAADMSIDGGPIVVTGSGATVQFKPTSSKKLPVFTANDKLTACNRYTWFLKHYRTLSTMSQKDFSEHYPDFSESYFAACDGTCDPCGLGKPVDAAIYKDLNPPKLLIATADDVEVLWVWMDGLAAALNQSAQLDSGQLIVSGNQLFGKLPLAQFEDIAGVAWDDFAKLLVNGLPELPAGVEQVDLHNVNQLWDWTRDSLLWHLPGTQMCAAINQGATAPTQLIGGRHRASAFALKYGLTWHDFCKGLLSVGLKDSDGNPIVNLETLAQHPAEGWYWFKTEFFCLVKADKDFFDRYPSATLNFAPEGRILGKLPIERFECVMGAGSWAKLNQILIEGSKEMKAEAALSMRLQGGAGGFTAFTQSMKDRAETIFSVAPTSSFSGGQPGPVKVGLGFKRLTSNPLTAAQPADAVGSASSALKGPKTEFKSEPKTGAPEKPEAADDVLGTLWKAPLDDLNIARKDVLIVHGSRAAVAQIRQLVAQFDWPPHSIRLRIQICELREDAIRSIGINLDDRQRATFVEQPNGGSFEALSAGDFRRNTGLELQATLDALMTDGKASILAEPVLTTVEGEAAMYTATENVPYFAGGTFDTDTNTTSQTIAYRDIGIKLAFRPRLGRGNSLVIDVMPEISTLVDQNVGTTPSSVEDLLPPRFLERRMRSVVTVENGEPFVLAGMITEKDRFDVDKVPLLSELPLLGKLFRKKTKTRESSEVCIIVIPEIVRNPYAMER